MTDAGTTQDNLILPAPPVGALPIWLDRMKNKHDIVGAEQVSQGRYLRINNFNLPFTVIDFKGEML